MGIKHHEQVFTALNSEFLTYSRTPKRKTKTGMVMLASVFMLLEKKDSEKYWSILMKNLIGTMNFSLSRNCIVH